MTDFVQSFESIHEVSSTTDRCQYQCVNWCFTQIPSLVKWLHMFAAQLHLHERKFHAYKSQNRNLNQIYSVLSL